MRIGIFTQYIQADTVEELALRVRSYGLDSVILDTFPGLDIDLEQPSEAHGARIKAAFLAADVEIAAIGGYVNFIHPDEGERQAASRRFAGMIDLCRQLGVTRICSEVGTYHPDWGWDAANLTEAIFELSVECIAPHVNAAYEQGIHVCLEPYVVSAGFSAERVERLVHKLGAEKVRVVIDPAGLLTRATFDRQQELLADQFQRLGGHIGIVHVQDCRPAERWNDHFIWQGAGEGLINYGLFMRHLVASGYEGPLILEFLTEARIPASIAHVRRHWDEARLLKEDSVS